VRHRMYSVAKRWQIARRARRNDSHLSGAGFEIPEHYFKDCAYTADSYCVPRWGEVLRKVLGAMRTMAEMTAKTDPKSVLQAGLKGGLLGGVTIWIYEAVVWVGAQHLLPLAGIPRNATGLVFGSDVQASLGLLASVIGTLIHFLFAVFWGVLFACIWPYFKRRGFEATLVALPYAMIAWIVMHAAIMIASDNHPNYYDPNVIIGGFMSHFFFAVPMALYVKHRMSRPPHKKPGVF